MSTARKLSPEILRASKKAQSFDYDKTKYVIVDTAVKRDPNTGMLTTKKK